jgi:hypothetical protein
MNELPNRDLTDKEYTTLHKVIELIEPNINELLENNLAQIDYETFMSETLTIIKDKTKQDLL